MKVRTAVMAVMLAALCAGRGARADTESDAGARANGDDARPGPPLAAARTPRPALLPAAARSRACSFRLPICVQGNAAPRAILAALASAERAWDTLTGALALPPPDPDPDTRAYDVFLVDALEGGAQTLLSSRDVRSRVDRASAYTLVDRRLTGCALETAMAREVARASLFRAAPATDEGTARAQTAYLARLAVPCAMGDPTDIADFQAHPERPVIDTWAEDDAPAGVAFDRGASLFFWWLDASFGAQPGALVRAAWALSPTMTPLGAARWINEPDTFDVLRVTFKNALTTGSTIDDLFLGFATARAFFGTADDGTHLPEARPLGAAVALKPDWEIDWPAKPRRLAAPRAIAPTGAAYVAIRHAGASAGARLRIEASWEEHAKMRWVVVKRDAAGRETGRVLVPTVERATEAQVTVVELDGVDSLLVIGVNAGDAAYAFDPDDEAWEPHGWLLTLAAE